MPATGLTEIESGRQRDSCALQEKFRRLGVQRQLATIEPGEIARLRSDAANPRFLADPAYDVIPGALQMFDTRGQPCLALVAPRGKRRSNAQSRERCPSLRRQRGEP